MSGRDRATALDNHSEQARTHARLSLLARKMRCRAVEKLELQLEQVVEVGRGTAMRLRAMASISGLDAAVFLLVHDVTQSPPALSNLAFFETGARAAATAAKLASAWALPVNLCLRHAVRAYITATEGFGQLWRHMAGVFPNFNVRSLCPGAAYLAWGPTQ